MFPSWARHQRIRECKPKFPGPENADNCDGSRNSAASCGELPQDAADCGFNPNPNPNPNPDPTTAPNPDPDISGVPKPTGVPKPSTSPEEEDTEVDPDKYKTDLRLVFPFCIPFDLVHLIQAFEAEPEAPVFEFPLDLELENPWTGKKILDYHHVFKLDMSDYEPVIKIFRIFEIIFFIIGLLMITRQQMIKG